MLTMLLDTIATVIPVSPRVKAVAMAGLTLALIGATVVAGAANIGIRPGRLF